MIRVFAEPSWETVTSMILTGKTYVCFAYLDLNLMYFKVNEIQFYAFIQIYI